MRMLISAEGNHEPAGHLIRIDHKQAIVDLSGIEGTLHDPSIARVEWGTIRDGALDRPGGFITRTDGSRKSFFDKQAITPYVRAFEARIAEIEAIPPPLPPVEEAITGTPPITMIGEPEQLDDPTTWVFEQEKPAA